MILTHFGNGLPMHIETEDRVGESFDLWDRMKKVCSRIWNQVICSLPVSDPKKVQLGIRLAAQSSRPPHTQDLLGSIDEEELNLRERRMFSRERLQSVGSPRKSNSLNQADTDLIARTVMRHPGEEAKAELYTLHRALNTKLLGVSDDGLTWLLGGSSMNARGGFKDALALRAFLQEDPSLIPVSRLITGLHTLVTAIAYRNLGHIRTVAPARPQTEDQTLVLARFLGVNDYSVPDHQDSYPDSRSCMLRGCSYNSAPTETTSQFTGSYREEISDGSDIEDNLPPPQRIDCGVFAKRQYFGGVRTWVGAARKGNIPVRLGISGTTLHSLSVIESLYGLDPGALPERKLELLMGTLIIPTYVRGDYHSVAETGAAFRHFMANRRGSANLHRAVLTPKQALEEGLNLMRNAVGGEYYLEVNEVSKRILDKTVDVGYLVSRRI